MDKTYYDIKYANLLLNQCLVNDGKKPLLIIYYDKEIESFINILEQEAKKLKYKEVIPFYFPNKEIYSHLKKTKYDDIDLSTICSFEIFSELAEKEANVLYLESHSRNFSKKVSYRKECKFGYYYWNSVGNFHNNISIGKCPHCIAEYPTMRWAKEVYPDRTPKQAYLMLYYSIMEFCMVNKLNPKQEWTKLLKKQKELEEKLNDLRIRQLCYKSNDTDCSIELPDKHIWVSGGNETDIYGNHVQNNMPTYEIYTSPIAHSTSGKIRITKPFYSGKKLIHPFDIYFRNGKAYRFQSEYEEEQKLLENMFDEYINQEYLGECALVENTSPIYQSNTIFNETLYDENASCHIALGNCIRETIENGQEMTEEELKENGLNVCYSHTDVMVGSDDLEITADTKEGEKLIYSKGRIVL